MLLPVDIIPVSYPRLPDASLNGVHAFGWVASRPWDPGRRGLSCVVPGLPFSERRSRGRGGTRTSDADGTDCMCSMYSQEVVTASTFPSC